MNHLNFHGTGVSTSAPEGDVFLIRSSSLAGQEYTLPDAEDPQNELRLLIISKALPPAAAAFCVKVLMTDSNAFSFNIPPQSVDDLT